MKQILDYGRYFFVLLSFTIIFQSCDKGIDGKYIKIKDNGRKSALNVLNMNLIKEVEFGDDMCRFDYFGTTMGGKYRIDGNYLYIEVGYDLGTLTMEIVDNETLEGEGWIAGTFKKLDSFRSKNRAAIGTYSTTSDLNVRCGPSTDYAKIETITKGTKVKVVKMVDSEWCELEHNGYSGFVSTKYLK